MTEEREIRGVIIRRDDKERSEPLLSEELISDRIRWSVIKDIDRRWIVKRSAEEDRLTASSQTAIGKESEWIGTDSDI